MKILTTTAALATAALLGATAANAGLVAYFPINSGTDSTNFIDDVVDDPLHAVVDGTSTNNTASIVFNATRGGDVYSSNEDHRFQAGTQDIDLADGFTWSLWVNVASSNTADSGADVIIGTRASSGGAWNKVDIAGSNNWNGGMSYTTLADDTWHHVAYTGDSAGLAFWIDGVKVAEDLTVPTAIFNGKFEIGGTTQFSEDVTGLYDDIAVWDERLSDARIQELAAGGDVIPEPGSLALLGLGGLLIARRRRG